MKLDIESEYIFLTTPRAFDAPARGAVRQNIVTTFGTEKLEWCGYPKVKKKFEDIFIRFDRMFERERHTGRQTDRPRMTAKAPLP